MNKPLKVLHVDDDELILQLVKALLETSNTFSVVNHSSGPDALANIPSTPVDLIILDFQMPEMNGVETLYNLKENSLLKDIPVIFLTSDIEKHEIHQAKSSGVIGIISKPFDTDSLLYNVKSIYENYKNNNPDKPINQTIKIQDFI